MGVFLRLWGNLLHNQGAALGKGGTEILDQLHLRKIIPAQGRQKPRADQLEAGGQISHLKRKINVQYRQKWMFVFYKSVSRALQNFALSFYIRMENLAKPRQMPHTELSTDSFILKKIYENHEITLDLDDR